MMESVRRRGLTALVFGIALAALSACGGDGDKTAPTTIPSIGSAYGSATKVTEITPGAREIDQDRLELKPRAVTVKVGETIFVKNSETSLHTFDVNGKNLSGNMKKGDIVAWKGDAPGAYKVTCAFHPQMKATITVE